MEVAEVGAACAMDLQQVEKAAVEALGSSGALLARQRSLHCAYRRHFPPMVGTWVAYRTEEAELAGLQDKEAMETRSWSCGCS